MPLTGENAAPVEDDRPGYLELQLRAVDEQRAIGEVSDSQYQQRRYQVLASQGPAKPRGRFYTLKWLAFAVLAFGALNFVVIGGFALLLILGSEEERGLEEWVVSVRVSGMAGSAATFHGYVATDSELLRVESETPKEYLVSRDDLDGQYSIAIVLDSGSSIMVMAKCNGFTFQNTVSQPGGVVRYVCWR